MSEANNNFNSTQEILILKSNLDSLFLVVNGILILLFAGVAFWLVGYGFAFGNGNSFLGTKYFATYELQDEDLAKWFFQYATAATIVSGSMAERCDTIAYFVYSTVITGFLYPVIVHWAWADEGWLKLGSGIDKPNFHDFAGSGVVHLTGGTCALIGTILLGPRIGRFDGGNGIRGHSVPLAIVGGMILLIGFLAFNGGSQGSISNPGDGVVFATAICNTTISGSFGGLVTLLLVRAGALGKPKVLSVLHAMNGALTGMVSICAGVNLVRMWSSAVIGSIAAVVYLTTHIIILKVKVDDPLDAVAVHLGGGIWGILASPIFRHDVGILMTWNTTSAYYLLWSLAGLASILTWSAVISAIMFGILKKLNCLRVSAAIETRGLDLVKHNEPAYPAESWFEEQYQDLTNRGKRGSITPYDISQLPPFMRSAKRSLDTIHDNISLSAHLNNDFTLDECKNNRLSTNF